LPVSLAIFVCEAIRLALEAENIESRPIWKPMHMQPVFKGCECIGGEVAEELFNRGLCLPSGTAMTEEDLTRIVWTITERARKPRQPRNAGTGASRSGH
ncbi:MAG: DegT/DnrJ/EryC1/StrS aminotransferase, partial [Deltaproteobacteria bacterium]|nr:DegT/DnrJ/EryC1/StrS aminotransferase [Deltaproteobacteria bacterium]